MTDQALREALRPFVLAYDEIVSDRALRGSWPIIQPGTGAPTVTLDDLRALATAARDF